MKNSEIIKSVSKSAKNTVFSYVFSFLFFFSFILGIVSLFAQTVALNPDKYMERIHGEEYSEVVLETVYTRLEDMGDVITLEADQIYTLLDKDSAVVYSEGYTKTYITSILENKDFSSETVENYSISYMREPLKDLIKEFYETNDENTHEFSEEEFEIIYDYVEKQINGALKFLPTNVLEETARISKYIPKAEKILSPLKFALVPAVLFLVAIILLNRKSVSKLLYRAGGTLFVPSAVLFIPTLLFDGYNLGSRVVIAKSPLSVVFSAIIDTVVKGFKWQSLIFFIIAVCMIIAGAALTAFFKPKKETESVE